SVTAAMSMLPSKVDEVRIWSLSVEARETRYQPAQSKRGAGSQADVALSRSRGDGMSRGLDGFQRSSYYAEKPFSLIRELNLARQAMEQPAAEGVLELLDLLTDGALGHI